MIKSTQSQAATTPWSTTNSILLTFSQRRCKSRSQKKTSRQHSEELASGPLFLQFSRSVHFLQPDDNAGPLSVTEISQRLEEKRTIIRGGLEIQQTTTRRGFIDTQVGLAVTSSAVLEKVPAKDIAYAQMKAENERKKKVREDEARAKTIGK